MLLAARNNFARLAGLAMVIAFVVGSSAALATAHPTPVEYDALGDSYASGVGAPPYDPASGACARSDDGYPSLLDGRKGIELDDFAACSGATTATLVSGGQLEVLDADTDLATLMIGGNDIGWGKAVGACLFGPDPLCAAGVQAARNAISTVLPARLADVYAQVRSEAPHAHVVVVGYPRLFSPKFGDYFEASPAEQRDMNRGADLLNSVIAEVADDYGFQFVDVTKRFFRHGVNAPAAWIVEPTEPGALHPTAQGYQAYTAALTAQINPATRN